ncbi:hypothetical protein GCM10023155_47920 [Bremerella cremea]
MKLEKCFCPVAVHQVSSDTGLRLPVFGSEIVDRLLPAFGLKPWMAQWLAPSDAWPRVNRFLPKAGCTFYRFASRACEAIPEK